MLVATSRLVTRVLPGRPDILRSILVPQPATYSFYTIKRSILELSTPALSLCWLPWFLLDARHVVFFRGTFLSSNLLGFKRPRELENEDMKRNFDRVVWPFHLRNTAKPTKPSSRIHAKIVRHCWSMGVLWVLWQTPEHMLNIPSEKHFRLRIHLFHSNVASLRPMYICIFFLCTVLVRSDGLCSKDDKTSLLQSEAGVKRTQLHPTNSKIVSRIAIYMTNFGGYDKITDDRWFRTRTLQYYRAHTASKCNVHDHSHST